MLDNKKNFNKRNFLGFPTSKFNSVENKRAQVGESVTWIVATIIIITILGISIYAISFGSNIEKAKKVFRNETIIKKSDLLATKSMSAFLMQNDFEVYERLSNNDITDSDKKLADKIFNKEMIFSEDLKVESSQILDSSGQTIGNLFGVSPLFTSNIFYVSFELKNNKILELSMLQN